MTLYCVTCQQATPDSDDGDCSVCLDRQVAAWRPTSGLMGGGAAHAKVKWDDLSLDAKRSWREAFRSYQRTEYQNKEKSCATKHDKASLRERFRQSEERMRNVLRVSESESAHQRQGIRDMIASHLAHANTQIASYNHNNNNLIEKFDKHTGEIDDNWRTMNFQYGKLNDRIDSLQWAIIGLAVGVVAVGAAVSLLLVTI